MDSVITSIYAAFGNWNYLAVYNILLLIGLIAWKDKRKYFLFPCFLISALICNPIFYYVWEHFNEGKYWRSLWMLPIAIMCAAMPSHVIDKTKKNWGKVSIVVLAILLFVGIGSHENNIFLNSFRETVNADKLPEIVVEVGKKILEIDETPYVVSDADIAVYLRQFSGKIKSLYARDIVFYGANSPQAQIVYDNLNGDLKTVAQTMLNYDYEYLVIKNLGREEELSISGFIKIDQVNEYGIYRVSGTKTELRTYNEKHQVESITTVDENNSPKNNEYGYAQKRYKYSKDGEIVYVEYRDKKGVFVQSGITDFHDYLLSLRREGITVIISVRDEGTARLSEQNIKDLHYFGIKSDFKNGYRNSYIAVITDDDTYEEMSSDSIQYQTIIDGKNAFISSKGNLVGDESSIIIDNVEYSVNSRGMNIVVYDNDLGRVIDSVCFDTHFLGPEGMQVTRKSF